MSTESPDEIRAEIAETRRELSRDVDALEDKVSPSSVAHRQADRLRSGLGSVRERVMGSPDHPRHVRAGGAGVPGASDDSGSGVVGSAADSVKHAASSVGDTVSSAPQMLREQTAGNPLAAGLVAFGVGLLVAGLVPSSRVEQQAAERVKEAAEPLVESAKESVQTMRDDLQQPLQDSAHAVTDTARSGAQAVADSGRSAVDEVRGSTSGDDG
ncbi:DUF3618 domain-containing protein [Luteimicrobium sp. NPDC057192]|uniref:DUF3618 domain-containing protein n=1 Tax=Luteimicrobium sp. NPDC057192 TaxID=3346042 RepID=UPI003636F5DF